MENEIQPNVPPVQPLPQTPPVIPPSTNWSKLLLFAILGFVIILGSIFTGIQIGKNPTTNKNTTSSVKTSLTKECTSDKDCPSNTFCDYSTPGGEDSNGNTITGQPYGSQKCITKCQNNKECLSNQCKKFNIAKLDTITVKEGCEL